MTERRHRSVPAVMLIATATVSLVNYGFAAAMLWILPSRQYAIVASITALLLVFGTVAGASAPWVLAREIALAGDDAHRRQRALAFATPVALGQAAVATAVCIIIVGYYANWQTTATACGAAAVIFLASASVGYLQGTERFASIFALRVSEVVTKVALGVALVVLGMGTWGAVSGFAFGALLVLLGAAYYMRKDALGTWRNRHQPWVRSAIFDRTIWSVAGGIILIQAATAIMAGMDSVVASIMIAGKHQLATYQGIQILGRIPFYIASSLAIIVFPRLARLRNSPNRTIVPSLHAWMRLCGAATVVLITLPHPILTHILPGRYGNVALLLPWAALAGFSLGGINLVTTYWQAIGRCRTAIWILVLTCLAALICDPLSLRGGDVLHLAWSAAATSGAGLFALLVLVRRDWPKSLRGLARQAAIVVIPGVALLFLRGHVFIWAAAALVLVGIPALRGLYLYGLSTIEGRPRVLHLAFEDPDRPGAGGGSIRTREIDRRLALNFNMIVVCARYRGSRPRIEEGVRYVHIGLPWGRNLSLLSYFALLPWALIRYPGELVVEDFAAPFSSVAVPWLTSRPVVGMVQWLFAQEKASEYRLPFHLVERVGLASHRNLVAVSEDLAEQLRRRNPRAQVQVIENALPDEAFQARTLLRRNILYLGRLEIAQKGVDLLLEAFASMPEGLGRTLVIAGSGPDETRLRALATRLGLDNRVVFAGHVDPAARFDLLASAELVAMPSRYETFGMVAAEALAVGTPVVAFDIPCLRSIVAPPNGILVPAFDTRAFASAIERVLADDLLRSQIGSSGRSRVSHLRWDGMATVQQEFYSTFLS